MEQWVWDPAQRLHRGWREGRETVIESSTHLVRIGAMSHSGFANCGLVGERKAEKNQRGYSSTKPVLADTGRSSKLQTVRGRCRWDRRAADQQRPAPTLRVNWNDAARPGRRVSLSTPSQDPRPQCAWGRDPWPCLPQQPGPSCTLQEYEARGAVDSPAWQWSAPHVHMPACPAGPWVWYILNGNARPFFSRSRMVSSPHRLVSSMKGGEQILSSGDRGEPVSAQLPAGRPWPLPGTDPPPWGPLSAPCSADPMPQTPVMCEHTHAHTHARAHTHENSSIFLNCFF